MKNILLIFILFSQNNFSQKISVRELSIKENLEWISKFKLIENQPDKIENIINKIKLDSIINYNPIVTYITKNGHIHDSLDTTKPSKIVFVLSQKKTMWLLDLNQFPNFSNVLKFITADKVDDVYLLDNKASKTLFGYRGDSGTIMIKSNNKKLKRLLKKALKEK